ncbi:hypothetical protein B0H15DRAFT_826742 [Mycena belliarum]|uniref:Uncharacterized protein n=1 Tax=Mycena belliarum TaxID=1033014 RepID=A0AAD6XU17_9AGAR|nr:hypothetical protein B0H15DRAFT_826742 [Mycena belliae]
MHIQISLDRRPNIDTPTVCLAGKRDNLAGVSCSISISACRQSPYLRGWLLLLVASVWITLSRPRYRSPHLPHVVRSYPGSSIRASINTFFFVAPSPRKCFLVCEARTASTSRSQTQNGSLSWGSESSGSRCGSKLGFSRISPDSGRLPGCISAWKKVEGRMCAWTAQVTGKLKFTQVVRCSTITPCRDMFPQGIHRPWADVWQVRLKAFGKHCWT